MPLPPSAQSQLQCLAKVQDALRKTGIVVSMATTNLFADPAFKDGAFTANDPKVRAFALQKTMRAIDLGVELGAKSALWRQILANVLNVELVTVNTTEGAAYGAALLASVGVGFYSDVPSACDAMIQVTGRTTPGDAAPVCPAYYERYRALYPALAAEFTAMAGVVSEHLAAGKAS